MWWTVFHTKFWLFNLDNLYLIWTLLACWSWLSQFWINYVTLNHDIGHSVKGAIEIGAVALWFQFLLEKNIHSLQILHKHYFELLLSKTCIFYLDLSIFEDITSLTYFNFWWTMIQLFPWMQGFSVWLSTLVTLIFYGCTLNQHAAMTLRRKNSFVLCFY